MKIDHVPYFFKSKKQCFVYLLLRRPSWPQHLPRKHVLDQTATCDSIGGHIPHPRDLFLAPSLICKSRKKVDYSVQSHQCMRTHIFGYAHILCVNLTQKNHLWFCM